jgi:hypothetical protein
MTLGNLVTVTLNPVRFNTAGVVDILRGTAFTRIGVLEPPSLATPSRLLQLPV